MSFFCPLEFSVAYWIKSDLKSIASKAIHQSKTRFLAAGDSVKLVECLFSTHKVLDVKVKRCVLVIPAHRCGSKVSASGPS